MRNEKIKLLVRVTGIFYFLIIICGLFSEGFVRMELISTNNPAATLVNIKASETLFRLGFLSDLIMVIADIAAAILFYFILKPVSEIVASFAAIFRLGQASIISMNLLNHFSPLLLISLATESAWGPGLLEEQVAMYMVQHRNGYLISQFLFAFNCLFMAYLIVKSNFFPKLLGYGVGAAGVIYLADSIVNFLFPSMASKLQAMMVIPVVAELSLCGWLLVKGSLGIVESKAASGRF